MRRRTCGAGAPARRRGGPKAVGNRRSGPKNREFGFENRELLTREQGVLPPFMGPHPEVPRGRLEEPARSPAESAAAPAGGRRASFEAHCLTQWAPQDEVRWPCPDTPRPTFPPCLPPSAAARNSPHFPP